MAEIGKRIKQKREELKITQEELAVKLGYKSKTTIAKIENGTNDIVQSKVVEFAKALNTTVAYLMGWDDNEKQEDIETAASALDLVYNDKNIRLITEKCSHLKNEASIKRLLRYIDLLIEEENEP